MDYVGFLAPSGEGRSPVDSPERTINMYLQPSDNNPKQLMLYSMPGLQQVMELPSGPVRGLYESTLGRVFAVTSSQLFELFAGHTFLLRGSVPNGTSFVSMTDDGQHLVLSVEGVGLAYHFATNVLTTIAPEDSALTFGRVQYIDGRITANRPGTRQFYYSDILNATSWPALNYYGAEARADLVVTHYIDHREVWLFGTQSIEVWTSTGDSLNPFQRMQGVFLEQGIAAPWAVNALDNTLYWLGGTPRGDGPAWRAQGYTPVRISTHSLESMMSTLLTVGDVISFTARHGGHAWYGLWYPGAETTWIYDTLTSSWTELATLAEDGALEPYPCYTHCMAFGLHMFGSATDGTLAVWNPGYHFYQGRERYCMRTGPFLRDDESGSTITFSSLQLRCLTGQGLDGEPYIGRDPKYRLSWTKDGERFSYEHIRTAGRIGGSERRVTWRQLGSDRARAFKIATTDPTLHCWRGVSINI